MKRLAVIAACLVALTQPCLAQKTKAVMNAEITANLPNNTTGSITPAVVRATLTDMVNSWQQFTGVNAQVGTTYAVVVGDYGQLLTFTNGSAVAVSLPQAIGSFTTFNAYFTNLGAGAVTITPTVSTIDGAASFTIATGQSVWVVSDSANYQVFKGFGSGVVNSGTAGQLAYYATTGAAVSGLTGGATGTILRGGSTPAFTATPTLGTAGSVVGSLAFANATSGTITVQPPTGALGSSVLTWPAATDTLVGKATTDIFTNKTYDTAGTGNSFLINGLAVTANTGTGSVVRATSPTMSGVTVTGSFTATGLVTNADLVNSATTVNGQTCTLGSTCTITAAAITVGTTIIGSGTTTRVLFDNAGVLGEYSITGTGNVAMSASPTFTGTITAAIANFSGVVTLPNGTAGAPPLNFGDATSGFYRPTINNVGMSVAGTNSLRFDGNTGVVFRSDYGLGWASDTSYTTTDTQLFRYGAGKFYLVGTTPTFALGGTSSSFPAIVRNGAAINVKLADGSADAAITALTYNGNTLTTGTYTLTGTAAKTLNFTNSLTLSGTDSTTMTFPSVSATISRTVASGAKALATGAISSAACTAAQTDTATGTLTTDAITASFNGDPTAVTGYVPLTSGMLTIMVYPTADTVNFKVCNNTSSSITPGAVTINWRVVR